MSTIDEVKEFINYLKVLLVFLLVTCVGLIAWLANNYKSGELSLIYMAVIAIVFILITSIILNKKIIKDIKSLKDL